MDTIEKRVDTVYEMLDELNTLTAGIGTGINPSNSTNNALNDAQRTDTPRTNNRGLAVEIINVIEDNNQPVMMETIVSETDSDPHPVYQKTGALVDKGAITCVNQNSDNPQYKLSGAML